MLEKLKSWLTDDTLFLAVLLILVGVISFGLGRQSALGSDVLRPEVVTNFSKFSSDDAHDDSSFTTGSPAGVIFIEAPAPTRGATTTESKEVVRVVGSRSGTKYHLENCPGAAQIKEENKVYFDSVLLAKAAGYTPAANCPGLD